MISEFFPIVVFFWIRNPILGHDYRLMAMLMDHDIS